MQIDNRVIEYDRFGDGDALVLIHGLGGTSNFWRPVVAAFAGRHTVIAPDLPSAARSELDPNVTIESLANDVQSLLDKLDIENARLVGHSMGTIVCQHLAAMDPERISDLVLLGPLAEPPEPARDALKARAAVAREQGMNGIADTIADVALAEATKLHRPNVQGFVREMVIRQLPEAYAVSCEALASATRADLSRITSRCLLVTGAEDGVAPPANVRELAENLASSEVHVLENCGHWTLTEQPEAVVSLMQSFYS